MARKRSSSYPAYTIKQCVSIVENIYKNYGDSTFVKGEDLAVPFNMAYPTMVTRISACVQYGLLEKKTNEGYKPSGLFRKIYRPLNEDEASEALIQAFNSPNLYTKIVKRLEGHPIPMKKALANILYRDYGIADKVSEKAASVFLDNIKHLNLISDEKLVLEASNDSEESDNFIEPANNETTQPVQARHDDNLPIASSHRRIEIPLTKGKVAVLSIPQSIEHRDLDIINAQINVLKIYIESNDEEES